MTKASLLTIAFAFATQACSGGDHSELPPLSSSSGGNGASAVDTGGTAGSTGGSVGATGGGAGEGVNTGGSAGSGGESTTDQDVAVTDIEASACEPLQALDVSAVKVIDSGLTNPAFDRIGVAGDGGDRQFAFDSQSTAIITFGPDASNPSSFIYGVVAVAPQGPELAVLFDDGSDLYLQRYDGMLAPAGGAQNLAPGTASAVSLGASAGQLLALWADANDLRGRLIGEQSASLVMPDALASAASCQSALTATATGFNVAWACHATETVVGWATVAQSADVSSPTVAFRHAAPLELKQIVHTQTGNLLLLNEGSGNALIVAHVDDSGTAKTLQRYLGVSGFGLAATNDGVGLIAATPEGQTVFRVLESTGAPKTPWRCMSDEASSGGAGAVMADATGYVAVVRHDNGSAWMMNLDANGLVVP